MKAYSDPRYERIHRHAGLRLPQEKLKVSLVAADLDGTLLGADHDISLRTAVVLHELADRGIPFTLATGRLPARLPTRLAAHTDLPLGVFCNGAYVARMPERRVLFRCSFSRPVSQALVERLSGWRGYYECYSGGEPYTDKAHDLLFREDFYAPGKLPIMRDTRHILEDMSSLAEKESIEKLFFPYVTEEEEAGVRGLVSDLPELRFSHSSPRTLEINHEAASKLSGLQALARELGVPEEEILVFGDEDNDLPMLEGFPLSVTMANAPAEVSAKSRFDTLSNEEDGVAWFLEHFVL